MNTLASCWRTGHGDPRPTLKVYLFNLRYLLNPNDNVLSLLSAERERLVAIVNHGGAVCDKYHRLFVRRQNVLQQLALGFGVERRRGLVEQHHLSVAQQGTSNGDALCLTLAQSATLF